MLFVYRPNGAFAAFCAMAFRCSGDSVFARALPPLEAPEFTEHLRRFVDLSHTRKGYSMPEQAYAITISNFSL